MNNILIEIDDSGGIGEDEAAVDGREDHFGRINADDLSYAEFFGRFMRCNKPVVICGVADRWECLNWVNRSDNKVCFDYLRAKIPGDLSVPVANCNKVYFNSHEKSRVRLEDYLRYWERRIDGSQSESEADDLLYLKDWHLRNEAPDYQFYETPIYFSSDWLNEFCVEKGRDDYRFVYMGPRGSW